MRRGSENGNTGAAEGLNYGEVRLRSRARSNEFATGDTAQGATRPIGPEVELNLRRCL